jgi:hypothetical protein
MTSAKLKELALKKELLQARSRLYRLRIRLDLDRLSEAMTWAQAGVSAAKSLPLRSGLVSLALQALGHGRLARMVRFASRVVLFAKLTGIAIDVARKFREPRSSVAD